MPVLGGAVDLEHDRAEEEAGNDKPDKSQQGTRQPLIGLSFVFLRSSMDISFSITNIYLILRIH